MMKKIRSGLLAVILIMAMMAAGCGKSSTPSTDDTKPIEDIESVDEKNEAEESKDDSASQEQEEAEAETDSADDEQANSDDEAAVDETEQEDANSGDDATDQAETSEDTGESSGHYTDEQLQQLYASIKETVQKEYLEPNGIAAADFHWPVFDATVLEGGDEDNAWAYLGYMAGNYAMGMDINDNSKWHGASLPSDQTCQLMKSVVAATIEWYKLMGDSTDDFWIVSQYINYEKLSENVDFTD